MDGTHDLTQLTSSLAIQGLIHPTGLLSSRLGCGEDLPRLSATKPDVWSAILIICEGTVRPARVTESVPSGPNAYDPSTYAMYRYSSGMGVKPAGAAAAAAHVSELPVSMSSSYVVSPMVTSSV